MKKKIQDILEKSLLVLRKSILMESEVFEAKYNQFYNIISMRKNVNYVDLIFEFRDFLKNFTYDDVVNNIYDKINKFIKNNDEVLVLERHIERLESNNSNGLYNYIIELLNKFSSLLQNKSLKESKELISVNRRDLIEELNKFSNLKYIPVILEDLIKYSDVGFYISNKLDNYEVKPIYSIVEFISPNKYYFYLNGRVFKYNEGNILLIKESSVHKHISDEFLKANEFLNTVCVIENNYVRIPYGTVDVIIDVNENKYYIESKNDNNREEINGDLFKYLIENGGLYSFYASNDYLNNIKYIVDNMNFLYEIDYGKLLVRKEGIGKSGAIFKINENLYYYCEFDEINKKARLYERLSTIDLNNIVYESLNFKLSKSLDFSKEKRILEKIERKMKKLVSDINLLNEQIEKVNNKIKENIQLENNRKLKRLIRLLEDEIYARKNEYERLSKIRNKYRLLAEEDDYIDDFDTSLISKKKKGDKTILSADIDKEIVLSDQIEGKEIKIGDRVEDENGKVGTVVGKNEVESKLIVVYDNGKTEELSAENVKLVSDDISKIAQKYLEEQ